MMKAQRAAAKLDWRDPSHYPDPAGTTLHRWAWEFLRRNPTFETEANDAVQSQLALKAAGKLPLAWKQQPLGEQLWAWGVRRPYPVDFNVAPWLVNESRVGDEWINATPWRADRMVFEFDLMEPVEPQIERARRTLVVAQNAHFPIGKRKRNRPDKLRDYLRVLDAVDAGATPREMLAVFALEHPAINEKMLGRWKRRAVELRDGGYRELLAL